MHFLLVYELSSDYLERRSRYRKRHLELSWAAADRGELLLGGAVGDPVDEAILLFSGDGPEAARRFAEQDPYVKEGLVKRWRVRPWTTVAGKGAASPVRPETL